jgi:peptidyl-prolyl cis-trans isomerase B (cyclophilin B)
MRQRAAARARLEREMAARAEAARRKRLLQAQIGAGVGVVVVIGLVVWIIMATSGGGSQPVANPSAGPAQCDWTVEFETSPSASPAPSLPPGIKDVGLPPTKPPQRGFQVVTMDTNHGVIKMEMDLSKTPCTAASIAHLANQKFYDNSTCHRMVAEIFALQCGDPSGSGSGGATYRFADENLPKDKLPAYHGGDVAMANTGQPGSNGSQFFFLWDNSTLPGNYSLFAKVFEGMDIVKKIAAGGDDGAFAQEAGGGHPKIEIKFKTVRAGPVTESSSIPAPTAAPSSSASPGASGSAGAAAPGASGSATPRP